MGVKLLTIYLTVLAVKIPEICSQMMINNNMVASILQDIMSPANTQSAMQLLQMAAAGSNRQIAVPEVLTPGRIMSQPIETAMPVRTMMPREVPRGYITREIEQPTIITQLEVMPVRNEGISARFVPNVINTMPSVEPRQYSQQIVEPCQYPQRMVEPRQYSQPMIEPRQYRQPMLEPCPMMTQRLANFARPPAEILPTMSPSLVSPFLPVASPVSAFAPPASNMLPPPTQGRSQYLRKVPIPPPTL